MILPQSWSCRIAGIGQKPVLNLQISIHMLLKSVSSKQADFNTHAVVSVVTKEESDDANGCNIANDFVWLQVCRVGQSFAFHYSTDGERFYMMRFFNLPAEKTMKVGLLAQAPTGNGGIRVYENLTIESRTVKNIRMGE